ncbi:proteasome accessory factor B [Candidatus Planktophila dulcis]|uniref:helix-turn-helix transcriptional regulator n=1 Tax=Candidatus Planktophila dulcis TaxID=1884914 RepID=UPI000BC0D03E|nr:WYL domain-containing protein [Candidatus Planktophila dulcis]ASY21254.1 proteasome accessory factor B [Candidatus Planktophila dulcis]
MSRKSERLINLTIALLATKRFITKSEIFKTIEGYEGSSESKERMFERDKDDLRTLGIEIEVGSFDPLFNDEAGYRIKQERYQLDLGDITTLEISLLSLAAQAWQGASLDDAAQRALVKLNSLGIAVDETNLPVSIPFLSDGGLDLPKITHAIAEHQILEFIYRNYDLSEENRRVVPIGLSTRSGYWYLTGVDQSIEEVRTFRFDRVIGSFTVKKGPKNFETPENFDSQNLFERVESFYAVVDVRRGKGTSLRALASSTKSIGEWDQLQIPILDVKSLSALILWHGDDVYVHSPVELRESIVSSLKEIVKAHG